MRNGVLNLVFGGKPCPIVGGWRFWQSLRLATRLHSRMGSFTGSNQSGLLVATYSSDRTQSESIPRTQCDEGLCRHMPRLSPGLRCPNRLRFQIQPASAAQISRAAKRGCFKRGGFPIWTCPSFFVLFCPFLSFFVLFGIFPIFPGFPDLLGDGPGIFPIRPFSLSRPLKSTYEEQCRKGPRHNRDLSRKKWETPGFGNPPV